MTPHPSETWMMQIARNVTMEEWGFLAPGQSLMHDRDGKYCPAFQQLIDTAGVKRIPLPPLLWAIVNMRQQFTDSLAYLVTTRLFPSSIGTCDIVTRRRSSYPTLLAPLDEELHHASCAVSSALVGWHWTTLARRRFCA
jgi:hypothetical protein